MVFAYCGDNGVLLHAEDASGALYFTVGVSNSRLLVEFDAGNGVVEVSYTEWLCNVTV